MAKPRGSFQRPAPPKRSSVWRQPIGGPSAASLQGGWSSLARLMRSGLGIPESLRMLAGDGQDRMARGFRGAAEAIEGGETLADALSAQRGLINSEELQMIRASERVGDLAPVFEGIAEEIGARIALRRALIMRSFYPTMVLLASAIIGPLPLAVSGGAGAYLLTVGKNLLAIFLLGPGLYFGARALAGIPAVGEALRALAWRVPLGAGWYRDRTRARFSRVLGRNLESGLPIYESIRTAAAVTADRLTIDRARRAADLVRGGDQLAPSLGTAGIFNDADRMQLVSAERSGDLDETFKILSKHYDERSRRSLRRLVGVFAGVLTFAVALYVAMSVVSGFKDAVLGPLELLEESMPYKGR